MVVVSYSVWVSVKMKVDSMMVCGLMVCGLMCLKLGCCI